MTSMDDRGAAWTVRVLECPYCGAPLPAVGLAGGQTVCSYCDHSIEVSEVPRGVALGAITAAAEADLLAMRIPDRHAHLRGVRFDDPHGTASVRAAWLDSRRRIAAGGSDEDEYAAYWAIGWLSFAYWWSGDQRRRQAVLESALDVLHDPGRRYAVHCMLARAAALDGDGAAARRWIEGCEAMPGSRALHSLRTIADAAIALADRDPAAALAALACEVAPPLASIHVQLRLEALAASGRRDEARELCELAYREEGAPLLARLERNRLAQALELAKRTASELAPC